MSTADRRTNTDDAQPTTEQSRPREQSGLVLLYDDTAERATIASAPPDETELPATEWLTVDADVLIDVREHQ